ncbi:regulatory protein RecX [Microbacterium sp. 1P10AE]|jgi:regulatory protein|uniref:regulatory protein RecX n=1 Tax=Microbacterium sp. 1P10AE TaxID=3132286 RepID=UPI0039A27149
MSDDAGRPGRDPEVSSGSGAGGAGEDALAPVIPLFGSGGRARHDRGAVSRHPSMRSVADDSSVRWALPGAAAGGTADDAAGDDSPEEIRDRAEALLLRRLRGRSLSLVEAGAVVREVEGADETVVDEVVAKFVDLGYLDDEAFAEQLAMSAIERRGQGRRAVVQTLRKRGIPREVADATVAELPDDDAERALEFARSKIRGVSGKDYDASLRRLAGQLARRGYASSVSLDAARQALAEAGVRRAPFTRPAASGVQFTPDD